MRIKNIIYYINNQGQQIDTIENNIVNNCNLIKQTNNELKIMI